MLFTHNSMFTRSISRIKIVPTLRIKEKNQLTSNLINVCTITHLPNYCNRVNCEMSVDSICETHKYAIYFFLRYDRTVNDGQFDCFMLVTV